MVDVKHNRMIDFFKGIACVGVVFMHILFPGMFGRILKVLCAWAVPVFFMIAGFYAYGQNKEVIFRRLIKIIKIFCVSYLLYFTHSFLSALKNNEVFIWITNNYNIKTPIEYIIFCKIDFAIPLWYLIAMIETYVVWYFVVKNKKESVIINFIPYLFFLQILLTSYCETKDLAWMWKINFVTRALPWFLVGYYIHTISKERLLEIKNSILVLGIFSGTLIVIIPTLFDTYFKFTCIGYIPYAISIFLFAVKYPTKRMSVLIEFIGAKLSLYIYVLHSLVGPVMNTFFKHLFNINIESNLYLWVRPFIVLFVTLILSLLIKMLLDRKKYRSNNQMCNQFDQ